MPVEGEVTGSIKANPDQQYSLRCQVDFNEASSAQLVSPALLHANQVLASTIGLTDLEELFIKDLNLPFL